MIPDSIFEEKFDNGYGKFSLWDSFRAWSKMDMVGWLSYDHDLKRWLVINWRMIT